MSSLITYVACSCIFNCKDCIPKLSRRRVIQNMLFHRSLFLTKKSVFPGVSVIPGINQCQYTTLEIVWACSTFRQSQHTLPLSQDEERGRCFFSTAEFNLWSFVNRKRKMSFMKRQDVPLFDPRRLFFFLFLFGSVYLISGSSYPCYLINWFLSLVMLL